MEFNNNIPIYIQIVEKIKVKIISGVLCAEERLPSVREFAIQMQVNPNTMQKALTELEELGLIFTERTNGKFVTKDKGLIEKYKAEYAKELSEKYFENMLGIGYTKKQVLDYLKELKGEEK